MASEPKRYFFGLDLVRGIAAIAILFYHADYMFGFRRYVMPGAYTAVDLFFMLSGFVIAKTYEDAVAMKGMDFKKFAVRRLARLYPLYLATTVVGIFVMTAEYRSNFGSFDVVPLTVSAIANLFFIPKVSALYDGGVTAMFPFNPLSWSIFFELVINVCFFFVFSRLRTRTLVVVWLLSAAAEVVTVAHWGSIFVGMISSTFLWGFPRVAFPFLTGMLIWRRFKSRPWSNSAWVLYASIAVHLILMQCNEWMSAAISTCSDFFILAILLPMIVSSAVGAIMSGPVSRVGRFLGDSSYSVYLTQGPLIVASAGFVQLAFRTKAYSLAPYTGLVFVPFCIIESYFVFIYFEAPMRRWVTLACQTDRRSATTP